MSRKVLVVEDDTALRNAYQTALTLEGYHSEAAADGLEALELVAARDYDVILIDMLMPNLGGLEFLKRYQGPAKHPATKIIVFSNMSVPHEVKQVLELGATKYLTKSNFTPKEMVHIIAEVLQGDQA